MKIQWLKLDVDILDNSKIKKIRNLAGGDQYFVLWVGLLTLGMKCKRYGILEIADGIPYQAEDFSANFGLSMEVVKEGLCWFAKLGMIEIHEGNTLEICDFRKHQNIDGIEYNREMARIRQQRKREKQKFALIPLNTSEEKRGDEMRGEERERVSHANVTPPVTRDIRPSTSFERLFKLYEKRWTAFFPTYYREQAIAIIERVQPTDDELTTIINAVSKPEWILERINGLENKKRKVAEAGKETALRKELRELNKKMDACTVESEWHVMDKRFQEIRNTLFSMGLKA
jgi:predicted phage replisome organizer